MWFNNVEPFEKVLAAFNERAGEDQKPTGSCSSCSPAGQTGIPDRPNTPSPSKSPPIWVV
jgi:hypothetical protein